MEDEWGELNFEFIDWNDITDAEFSGDQEAIERLMNQSQELRRQHSISDTPKSSEPTTPCCLSTPRDTMPFEEFLEQENRDPKLFNSAPSKSMQHTPFLSRNTLAQSKRINSSKSYAQITRGAGKAGKRRTDERFGLSPIDLPRKKNFRQLLSPPPPFSSMQITTPDPLPLTTELLQDSELCMDTSTPESDRLLRPGGVQRRLFGGQTSSPQQQEQQQKPPHNEKSGLPPPWHTRVGDDVMVDIHRLAQRQRQIDMGKETIGYERYSQIFPKWKRSRNHPWTPDKHQNCSTRAWQGQMKQWRRNLHKYDPPSSSNCSSSPTQEQQHFTSEDAALCGISLESGENPLQDV